MQHLRIFLAFPISMFENLVSDGEKYELTILNIFTYLLK